jgi:ABC-type Fe3+/spermidine/putrescine transport system ATPase subunit
MTPFIEWRGLTKAYAGAAVLEDFSLSVERGEILAILGPSGSGKSTLLRITAGLESASAGSVLCDGSDLSRVPPHRRGFGLMFQDYCLFPHLDVQKNIAFGLARRGLPRHRQVERVKDMLRLVRLDGFERRSVLSLSGGEQQRVALARSLAPAPGLLMLDEPLGALDATLRSTLLGELADILRTVGVTVLYVTHDHREAMTVASRIAVVNAGALEQAGTAADLVRCPLTPFVAGFLGLGALVPGTVTAADGAHWFNGDIGRIPVPGAGSTGAAVLLVRPQALDDRAAAGGIQVRLRMISRLVGPQAVTFRVAIEGGENREYPMEISRPLGSDWPPAQAAPGDRVTAWVDPAGCALLTPGR